MSDEREILTPLQAALEAILFAAGEPLSAEQVAELLAITVDEATDLLHELRHDYDYGGRGIELVEVAGGYRLMTRPDFHDYVQRLRSGAESAALSRPAIETLAVIAYRQPVTRAEIEAIRGVKCEKAINTLLERGLIKEMGRRRGPGRPIIYGTTRAFLEHFGLRDLSELPPLPARDLAAEEVAAASELDPAPEPEDNQE
ncbi:MAG: SMC-Scp complex subunit ScpB [Chloroflexota bacterium]